jgi:hypothetical protein
VTRAPLDNPGRLVLAQGREGRVVVRAVQDDFVAPVGQGRPAIGEVPDVIGPGRLKAARTEWALSRREIRTLLPPRGDNDIGTRQGVDTQVGIAHAKD